MNKFSTNMYLSVLFASNNDQIIFKKIDLMNLASIVEFLSSYVNLKFLDNLDIYIVNGCLLKENNPAYALYYDGDEVNFSFNVIDNEQHKINTNNFHRPTILISSEIVSEPILFETTLIHELCHYLDGVTSGEEMAQDLEYIYLCDVYGFSEDAAYEYLHEKYD